MLELVTAINPSVIRAYNSQLMGYLTAFCGKKLATPSVLSLHINPDEGRKFQKGAPILQRLSRLISARLLEPYSLSNITKTICVTNFLVSYAKKYGARDIEVIYNKVYSGQFRTQRNPDQMKAKPRILSVGRLDPQKNQECLVRAIQNLNVELVLIGDGMNYDKLKLLAQDLDMAKSVVMIKTVPNREIQRYYWEADIFAISSFYEGFCIPVLEAMASALPVVVNDKEPLPEILGGTGLVVENSAKAFRKAFKRLLADPKLRRELGERARRRALEVDGEIMEEKEVELYEKLLASKGPVSQEQGSSVRCF